MDLLGNTVTYLHHNKTFMQSTYLVTILKMYVSHVKLCPQTLSKSLHLSMSSKYLILVNQVIIYATISTFRHVKVEDPGHSIMY